EVADHVPKLGQAMTATRALRPRGKEAKGQRGSQHSDDRNPRRHAKTLARAARPEPPRAKRSEHVVMPAAGDLAGREGAEQRRQRDAAVGGDHVEPLCIVEVTGDGEAVSGNDTTANPDLIQLDAITAVQHLPEPADELPADRSVDVDRDGRIRLAVQ